MQDHETLKKEWDSTRTEALECLRYLVAIWNKRQPHPGVYSPSEVTKFIASLPKDLSEKLAKVENRIATWASKLASTAQSSSLITPADLGDLRISTRKMLAALRSKDYSFQDASLMGYEDQVYGVQSATQWEREVSPLEAIHLFSTSSEKVTQLLLFINDSNFQSFTSLRTIPPTSRGATQHRKDTAFIIMWMSDEHPELTDVKVAITEVFQEFDITAIRADDIEHEGLITERILQEISSAEFLIADLTGARPNVYYEVGYAHALGKRVILYRKKDTNLHFDLAGMNVPTYINTTDLKDKLRKRLTAMTGLKPPVSKKKPSRN